MAEHADAVGLYNHALNANPNETGAGYTDIAERDADTDWQCMDNVDKLVRVDTDPVSYFVLTSISPTVDWLEFGSGGDLTGPAASVSGALAYFDDTTGDSLENISGITSDGTDLFFADSISAIFGTGSDLTISHNGTDTTLANTTGDLILDNTALTSGLIFRLGTDTAVTQFKIQNNSEVNILIIDSDGADTFLSAFPGELFFFVDGGQHKFATTYLQAGETFNDGLQVGHNTTEGFINAVGTGNLEFQHEGTAIATLSDATVLDFLLAATISTTAGDLTLNPAGEVNISTDLNFDGGGNIFIKQDGATVVTIDTGGGFNTGGDLFTFDVSAADYSGNRIEVTQEVVAPEITASQTFSFHEGSTQYLAAVPDLRSGRISTAVFKQATSVNAQDNNPQHIYIRANGNKMYIAGDSANSIHEYDLTTPWDSGSRSFLRSFSVSTQDQAPKGIFFKPDGLVMYVTGAQNSRVYQYDLSTAWNISTAVYNNDFVDISADTPNAFSLAFKPDGSAFFVVSGDDDQVNRYGMSSLWNITSASFTDEYIPTEPGDIIGVGFRSDGALMYITSSGDDAIYEYFLGTPWNITGDIAFQGSLDTGGEGLIAGRGIFFSTFHHKFYCTNGSDDSIYEYDLGLLVEGKVESASPNVIPIVTLADLLENAVSAVWTISADTTLNWIGDVEGSVRFSIDSGVTLHITGGNRATAKYTYDGSDSTTLFSGQGAVRIFGMKNLDSNDTATLVGLTGGGTLNIRDCLNITGWKLGSTNGQVFGIDSVFVNVDNGFDFINPTLVNITDWAIEGATFGADFISVITDDPASIMNFTDISGLALSTSGALFNFSGKSNNNARFSVKNCKVAKDDNGVAVGHIFEQNASGTGTVTAVADGSLAAGSITAQASNGSGGTTHTCTTTYHEDEEVTITGTTSYNGTFQIFNVVASTSFDTITTFVANDATGTVNSDRLTLTLSGGHPIGVPDDLKWTGANFYNGFYTSLNVVTNTLTLNGVFVGTDVGTLDDDVGLDQSDPRVVAVGNSPFIDSHYIAGAFVNNNGTGNGTIVNNTFRDMVFGTSGSALTSMTTQERWRLVDDVTGTFEYIGNEPFAGNITFEFTVVSSGGTVPFRFKWEIDTGSGFGDLPDAVEVELDVAGNIRIAVKTFPLAANKGDQIKPQITRNSGSSSITTSYATIYASMGG